MKKVSPFFFALLLAVLFSFDAYAEAGGGKVDLAKGVKGTLPVANGGTGLETIGSANQLLSVNTAGTALTYINYGLSSSVRKVSSGSTDSATVTDHFIAWNSSTASTKAQTIPACASTNANYELTIKDFYGDAGFYHIVISPSSGTVDGQTTLILSYNKSSVTLKCDGVSDWMVK